MDAAPPVIAEAAAAGGFGVGVAFTALVGLATLLQLWMWSRKPPKPEDDGDAAHEDDEAEPVHQDVPPELMPTDGVFTAETLAPLDGLKVPLCMGVCGKVVNCSSSGSIRHGAGYGLLWAGRDATYSLATLSLKPEDASKRDFKIEDFTAEQQKALAGWYKHFTTKYPIIGRMSEYDGWDFSVIEELAKDQTPFGLKKDSQKDSDAAVPEVSADVPEDGGLVDSAGEAAADTGSSAARAAPGALPADAQVFAKGARVQLKGLMSILDGQFGVLEDFNQEKGCFVIRLESTGDTMLSKPSNLLIVKS